MHFSQKCVFLRKKSVLFCAFFCDFLWKYPLGGQACSSNLELFQTPKKCVFLGSKTGDNPRFSRGVQAKIFPENTKISTKRARKNVWKMCEFWQKSLCHTQKMYTKCAHFMHFLSKISAIFVDFWTPKKTPHFRKISAKWRWFLGSFLTPLPPQY